MTRFHMCRMTLTALLLSMIGSTLVAQTITSGEGRVVVDGDYVRIESADGVTTVTDDGGNPGAARIDTRSLLTELNATEEGDVLRLALAGDILFDFGSATLTSAAEETLSKVAVVLRDRARGEVLVLGHTDSVGDAAANQRLSEARAIAVIRQLQGEGVPGSILVGRGLGETQPIAHEVTPNGADDPQGRARNRRVDLFVATTPEVDVRSAAGLVVVQSPSGPVRIEDGTVAVAGVRIDEDGVQLSGVTVPSVGASSDTTCAAGRHCEASCPAGDCTMICSAGAVCDYSCPGGDCSMQCAAGANCDFSCSGGDCDFSCAGGATCERSCSGGGCTGV